MPPTLIGLAFAAGHRSKRLTALNDYVDLTSPSHGLQGWNIQFLGAQVLFHAPPGWPLGRYQQPGEAKPDTPRVTVQIARVHLELHWTGVTDPNELDRAAWPEASKPSAKEKR